MDLNEEWKQEFLAVFPKAIFMQEAGFKYAYIPAFKLPEGCKPEECPLLLCISAKDGYDSRLYFSEQIVSPEKRSWNSNIYLLDSNWYSISWKTEPGLSYLQMLMVNLRAFK